MAVTFSYSFSLAFHIFRPGLPWAFTSCCPPPRTFVLFLDPRCLWRCVFSGQGCLAPSRLVAPPPFFFVFAPSLSLAFCVFLPGVPWASAPSRPPALPPFFSFFSLPPVFFCFLVFLFFFSLPVLRCGAGLCVLGCRVCPCVLRWCWPCRCSLCGALSPLRRWMVLSGVACCVLGVCCWAWLSSVVSWCILVSCFGGTVLVWPRGSPPCGLAWCVLAFRCPVLCSGALGCRVVVCCRALPFVCVVACACCLFPAAARLLCVFWGVVLCVLCPLRPVRCCAALCWCPCVVLSASSVMFLVPCVVGSWCRCLLFRVCWWLWFPGVVVCWCVSALVTVSGLGVARRLPCGVLLPCVVSCGAVLPCGAVLWCPVFFFCFCLAGGAGFLFPP